MNEEFKTLLAASNATHNAWCGAMSMHSALYPHIGSVGHAAAEAHLAELRSAHDQASAALDAHMQARRQFDTAAYEAQQRGIGQMQQGVTTALAA